MLPVSPGGPMAAIYQTAERVDNTTAGVLLVRLPKDDYLTANASAEIQLAESGFAQLQFLEHTANYVSVAQYHRRHSEFL